MTPRHRRARPSCIAFAAGALAVGAAGTASAADTTIPVTDLVQVGEQSFSSAGASFWLHSTPLVPTYECRLDGRAWVACTGQATFTGLTEGPHTLEVRAVESGVPDPTPVTRTWYADTTPPTGLAAVSPAPGALVSTGRPVFRWRDGVDRPEYDHSRAVTLTVGDGLTFTCLHLPVGVERCQPQQYYEIPDGIHTWRIEQIDAVGNRAQVDGGTFTVAAPPEAELSPSVPTAQPGLGGPGPALAGHPFRLSARAYDNSHDAVFFAWDIDGDGVYERESGTVADIGVTLPEGTYRPGVRVTDGRGLWTTARTEVEVVAAPPTGARGVSIEDGAPATDSAAVTLHPVWPAYATHVLVSNDGGFRGARRFRVAARIPWRLEGRGPDRVPRTVYVRFEGGPADPDRTFSDDIILDRGDPVITSAAVVALPGSGAAAKTRTRYRSRLVLRARDRLTGITGMQVTRTRGRPGASRPYRARVDLPGRPRPVWVRVRDRAGNHSAWRLARPAR